MNKNIIVYSLILILIILIIYLFLGFRQLSSTVSDNDPQSPTSSIPPTVDLSNYYTKSEADSSFTTKSYVDTNIHTSISNIRKDQGGNVIRPAGSQELGYEVDFDGKINFLSPVEFKENVDFKEHAGFYGTATLINKVVFTDNVDFHHNDTNFFNNVNFHKNVNILPRGSIIAWNHDTHLPKGWARCDGKKYNLDSNGNVYVDPNGVQTPDLRGRFVLGFGINDKDSNINNWWGHGGSACTQSDQGCAYDREGDIFNVGLKSGTSKVALLEANIPKHNHTIKLHPWNGNGSWDAYQKSGKGDGPEKHYDISSTWGGKSATDWNAEAHNNMPPYYVLIYIMRL